MRLYFTIGLFIVLLGFSCKRNIEKTPSELLKDKITEINDRKGYDEESYPLGLFTKKYYKGEADYAQEKINELTLLEKSQLTESEQISLDLLIFTLQETIDRYKFEAYLNPLLSDSGFHNSLIYEVKPLVNFEQVEQYIKKLRAIPQFVDQHLILLKEGLSKGISQPRVIFKGYESSYNRHIVDTIDNSFFYIPFIELPQDLTNSQKDSIRSVAKDIILNDVVPKFKNIKIFFETEYFPKTRTSIGVSETPNGTEYYQNRIDYYTTTSTKYTAESIHNIGLKEVSRIKKEMLSIIEEIKFKGSFSEFLSFLRTDDQFYAKSSEDLLKEARNICKKIDAQLPKYFKTLPRKPYGVAPVPKAIAPKYTSGRYVNPQEETDPGYYWVNTYDLSSRTLYTLPALSAHEAVPGHHLQISLNNELGDSIPQFRKDLYLSAYGEGWALYTEFLGQEMGIYTTPYEEFGKLTYEMWRACRLVVDTGIHSKGWSREQVVDFLSTNTALSIHEINTETDRYISWPGQALSYKIGELKIRELREKAQKELTKQFDIREFHEIILEQGTVTLPILEQRILDYIKSKKEEYQKKK